MLGNVTYVNPNLGEPPTGEPCAGDPPARFGGRGSSRSPYPYHSAPTERVDANTEEVRKRTERPMENKVQEDRQANYFGLVVEIICRMGSFSMIRFREKEF